MKFRMLVTICLDINKIKDQQIHNMEQTHSKPFWKQIVDFNWLVWRTLALAEDIYNPHINLTSEKLLNTTNNEKVPSFSWSILHRTEVL